MINYTNAQMEQERNDPKWLVVNGVDPEINDSLWVDIISMAGTLMEEIITPTYWSNIEKYRLHNGPGYKDGIAAINYACCPACNHEWSIAGNVNNGACPECGDVIEWAGVYQSKFAAPGLSKLDEHADCKITELKEQNAASGWVDGLPPIGEVCEVSQIDSDLWTKYTMLAYHGVHAWSLREGVVLPVNILVGGCKFRPIQTHKEKVIEAAKKIFNECGGDVYSCVYDAGMLTLPGESND